MSVQEWATHDRPAGLLGMLLAGGTAEALPERCKAFVACCLDGLHVPGQYTVSRGLWRQWLEDKCERPYMTPAEGAMFFAGGKVGQHNPLRLSARQRLLACSYLRDVFGPPLPYPHARLYAAFQAVPAAWCGYGERLVPRLCAEAVRTRDWQRLPIIADALEEARCDNEDILRHCRGEHREIVQHVRNNGEAFEAVEWRKADHARGCWVLDLLLGKE